MANPAVTFSVVDGGAAQSNAGPYKAERLTFGEGGGGGGMDKDYVDAKIDAVKAQNDARFAEVISRLDVLNNKVEHLPRPPGFWQLAGLAVSTLVVGITLLGVFADRFDGGVAALGLLDKANEGQRAKDAAQDERMNKLLGAIEALAAKETSKP